MASPAHAGARLVVYPLAHVATGEWQHRIPMRPAVTNLLTRQLLKAVVERFSGVPILVRTRQRALT